MSSKKLLQVFSCRSFGVSVGRKCSTTRPARRRTETRACKGLARICEIKTRAHPFERSLWSLRTSSTPAARLVGHAPAHAQHQLVSAVLTMTVMCDDRPRLRACLSHSSRITYSFRWLRLSILGPGSIFNLLVSCDSRFPQPGSSGERKSINPGPPRFRRSSLSFDEAKTIQFEV
jgi:hypothetical protein